MCSLRMYLVDLNQTAACSVIIISALLTNARTRPVCNYELLANSRGTSVGGSRGRCARAFPPFFSSLPLPSLPRALRRIVGNKIRAIIKGKQKCEGKRWWYEPRADERDTGGEYV